MRRILAFAVPYRAKLVIFIALSVVGAFLAVATPVLAGQVVNVIVARGAVNTIVWLAVVIALVAVADAAVSLVTRWYSEVPGYKRTFGTRRILSLLADKSAL
ncbi:hypothetical protein [Agreia pratensis]|uniref:hypothetical protein n=1 Tax=Agreia pratensis TaxID=150121 RepID=UPI001E49FE3B|nr:hypothetical protein [Agreia pratensis]